MTIAGYVPAIGEKDLDKITRSIRNLYENGAASTDIVASSTLRSYLSGLTLATAGASTTFSVAAGQAASSDQATMMTLAASISKTTGAWTVGSGNGSLDTGTIANSTWYHAWLIERTDTSVVDVLVSLSASAPTLPTNYTKKRRIGSLFTNGSGQWTSFIQDGDIFIWVVPFYDIQSVTPPTANRQLYIVTVPTGVNVLAKGRIQVSGAANTILNITSPSESDTIGYGAGLGGQVIRTDAANDPISSPAPEIYTNTSAQIGLRLVAGGGAGVVQWSTYGWTDRRGRDA